jgi:hypothetical protein
MRIQREKLHIRSKINKINGGLRVKMKNENTKKLKIVQLTAVILVCAIIGALVGVLIWQISKKETNPNNNLTPNLIEYSDINFLKKVSPDIEFDISSTKKGSVDEFFEIRNDHGEKVNAILSASNDTYIIKPPTGGYIGGDTFQLKLKDGVTFKDGRFKDKREISFRESPRNAGFSRTAVDVTIACLRTTCFR